MANEPDNKPVVELKTETLACKEVEWKIHEFSKLVNAFDVGEYLESGDITVGGCIWNIRLYPAGKDGSIGYVGVNLRWVGCLRIDSNEPVKAVKAGVSFWLESTLPRRKVREGRIHTLNAKASVKEDLVFVPESKMWGWHDFIKLSEVKDPAHGFLENDTLTLKTGIVLRNEHVNDLPLRRQQQSLHRHLELMLEDSSMSDVQVEVGESVFPAHKLVLAQAPFFQSCFSSEIGKSTTSNSSAPYVVKLQEEEVSADAFRVVLEFLYKVSKEPELPKGRALLDVHSAARYFMLPELEEICRFAFTKALSMEVLVPFLCYAHLHDLNAMKKACLDFALESGVTLSDFMLTADFVTLVNEHRDLYVELIECIRDTVLTKRKRKEEELLDE